MLERDGRAWPTAASRTLHREDARSTESTRRDVRTGGAVHRGAESPRGRHRQVTTLAARPAHLCRGTDAFEPSGNTRRSVEVVPQPALVRDDDMIETFS